MGWMGVVGVQAYAEIHAWQFPPGEEGEGSSRDVSRS